MLRLFPDKLIIHRGHLLLVSDAYGRVGGGSEGLYFRQTRFLDRLAVEVEGRAARPVCAVATTADAMIAYFLAASPAGRAAGPDPDSKDGTGGEIVKKGIELQLDFELDGGLHVDITVSNRALAEASIELAWQLSADYADQAEARSGKRRQSAAVERVWHAEPDGGELRLRYTHPRLDHGTVARLSGGPGWQDDGGRVKRRLSLPAGESARMTLDVLPLFARGSSMSQPTKRERTSAQPATGWLSGATRLVTPNNIVQSAWDRAVGDIGSLFLLDGIREEIYTPAAGIPGYQALFGRDALLVGCQSTLLGPQILRGALRALASSLGQRDDPRFDEQPGRVLHQRQLSPLALLGYNPFLHYYGDYTAPALFLIGLAADFAWTGDDDFLRDLKDPMNRVLAWMDRDGDLDGDGLYEYETRAGNGLKNQGWKDSSDAILYPDGRCVPDPIALVEIQGAYYGAKQAAALILQALGDSGRAQELLRQAAALRQLFNQRFWLPEERYFALALDPEKRPVRTIAPDPGQCLAYGIIDRDKAGPVATRLMAPDLFTGWGLRTLSDRHPAFNPFAYHLGSVWPLTTAMAGLGLKRYGLIEQLHILAEGLFSATRLFELNRLPESIGGHQRDDRHPHPGIYPEANSPQAWSASAVVSLIHTLLGLVPVAPLRLLLVDPALPEWLPEATLENLRIGDSRLTLRFERRSAGDTAFCVLAAHGPPIEVRRPSPGFAVESIIARFAPQTATRL